MGYSQPQTRRAVVPLPAEIDVTNARQAGRELMLAQSSDWPFMITNGSTEQYARRRFHDHLNRFHDLVHGLEQHQIDRGRLEALEYMDALFPELDYRLFA